MAVIAQGQITIIDVMDGAQGPEGPVGPAGKDGVAYMGETPPGNPAINGTWFQTDATGKVIALKKWNGSTWDTTKFDSATLAVQKLSALVADLGQIIAGDITGVTMNLANGKFVVDVNGNATFGGRINSDDINIKRGLNSQSQITFESAAGGLFYLYTSAFSESIFLQHKAVTTGTITTIANFSNSAVDIYSPILKADKLEGRNGTKPTLSQGVYVETIDSVSGSPVQFPDGISTPAFTAFSFGNNWTNYGGTYPPAGYTKTADGLVILRGAIKGGTFANAAGLAVCTLPVGWRPPYDAAFNGIDNDNRSVTIIVRAATGYVQVYSCQNYNGTAMVASNNAFISFDGIRFQT